MVNRDVDGYSKTLNHWKILWKTQKNNNPTENQKSYKTEV